MNLSLKVQNLGGSTPDTAKNSGEISLTHEFEVPNDSLENSRGRLFISLYISANGNFNLNNAAKLFLEGIQEEYYRNSEDTPMHAVEKALNRALKMIRGLKSEDDRNVLGSPDADLNISFATALIWNRVLYTSYTGAPAVYLVRGTGVRNLGINPAKNEIWTNSGILDDEDVIIIGTDEFARIYPSQEIINSIGGLSQKLEASNGKSKIAAILIKISTNNESSESKIEKVLKKEFKNVLAGAIDKAMHKFSFHEKLSDKFRLYQSKKGAPISSINSLAPTQSNPNLSGKAAPSPKRINALRSNGAEKKGVSKILVGLIMLAAIAYGNYRLILRGAEPTGSDEINSYISMNSDNDDSAKVKGIQTEDFDAEDKHHTKIIDTSKISQSIIPVDISTFSKSIMLLDSAQNSLYQINPETSETKKLSDEFDSVSFLECSTKLCFILGEKSFYVISPETPDKVEKYVAETDEDILDIYPYTNSVYLLTKNSIFKEVIGQTNTEPKSWIGDNKLDNAKALAVNYSVYVLDGRNIKKFTSGNLVSEFKIDNSYLLNPNDIEVYQDKLYVLDADSTLKQVVIYNAASGDFIEKIVLTDQIDPEIPTSISVTKDGNADIIFYKGKSIYKVKKET